MRAGTWAILGAHAARATPARLTFDRLGKATSEEVTEGVSADLDDSVCSVWQVELLEEIM